MRLYGDLVTHLRTVHSLLVVLELQLLLQPRPLPLPAVQLLQDEVLLSLGQVRQLKYIESQTRADCVGGS